MRTVKTAPRESLRSGAVIPLRRSHMIGLHSHRWSGSRSSGCRRRRNRLWLARSPRKRQRHNIVRRKCLHFSVNLKPQCRLRPPRYLPCRTRPSLNSKVSAAAAPASAAPKTTANKFLSTSSYAISSHLVSHDHNTPAPIGLDDVFPLEVVLFQRRKRRGQLVAAYRSCAIEAIRA